MNNLFKPKVKVYQKKLSEQEVYEQDSFYFLKVEDRTGKIIEEVGGEEFIEYLFVGLQCSALSTRLAQRVDSNYYDTSVKIIQRGERDVVGKIIITKRQIPLKFKEQVEKILTKLFSA